MAGYVASVETLWECEDAFAYLADFANIQDWDPGVDRAQRFSDDPLAVGARFERDGLRRRLGEIAPAGAHAEAP